MPWRTQSRTKALITVSKATVDIKYGGKEKPATQKFASQAVIALESKRHNRGRFCAYYRTAREENQDT